MATIGGIGHLFLNVFKVGSVSIGDKSFGQIGSPETNTDDTNNRIEARNAGDVEQSNPDIDGSSNIQANDESEINNNSNEIAEAIRDSSIEGETVSVTINYNDNSELPGFRAEGYAKQPPNIGQFDDAILITNVSSGSDYVAFSTREVFVNRTKYQSTFSLRPERTLQTRVSFSLEIPGTDADGVFLQFGLKDLDSGTTTLAYLVKIYADGEILWSGQVKYEESQIASVVLDTMNRSDIVIEYQIIETSGISNSRLSNYPLYFTEAKVLKN